MRIFFNLILIFLVFFSIGTETYNYVYGEIHPSILNEKSKFNRLIYYYSYFTVQSNIAVGISSLFLLFKPDYSKKWFRILRIDGIICIVITCIVYNLMLRHDHNVKGIMRFTNEALHVFIPFLAVLYWLLYGPRKLLDKKTTFFAIIPPLIYVIYIFIRGHFTNMYPYPFLDADEIGLLQALLNTGTIVLLFLFLEFILIYIDNLLIKKDQS
ncbi:hypothetical protein G8C41_08445 [Apibacter sp. B3706]|uniref:Pr6Pr family membrane protein n=1 Tax=Apibacter sp. B3706 TaxID=2656760 RepID=UPI00140C977A|nr:Pr6Pr family membrane protein [Apibacter sp. B3706]QII70836.1 hypothetical protein G8C41_08445 [Apibacter sp. B3706]